MSARGLRPRVAPLAAVAVFTLTATARAEPPAAPDPQPTPQPSPSPSPKPADGFSIGGFKFKLGGRIKLDVIHDFDPIGSTDTFDPRTIPIPQDEGTDLRVHARETRLNLDIRGPAEGRELRLFVEGDFLGSGNAFRLRHAFGAYGGLLAGQTWSTFMDEDVIPNTIDVESPVAYAFIRQGQVRWTQKLAPRLSWSIALEDNASAIVPPAGVPGKEEGPVPDLVTHFRWVQGRGHVQVSGFLGRARFRPEAGEPDDVTLWGVSITGKTLTVGKDYVYAIFTFGDGVGRYRSGGETAAPDESGQLHALAVNALTAGYQHQWSDRATSHAVYAVANGDNAFAPPTLTRRLDYAAVNFLYWFLKDRAYAGVEYLHGRHELETHESATANRLQLAVRFDIP
jgi:hypothetical protein